MKTLIKFKSLFVYSEKNEKYFYTDLIDGVNILYGKNTSGKSTFFQSLMYCLGINDGNLYLQELLKEEVVFRLDFSITNNSVTENYIIIRDLETLYIKSSSNNLIHRYNGVSGNKSVEHRKLKEDLHTLFGFNLFLESKDEYKPAPIEAILLPYYIAQSVGWVYLRKSFSSLDFYRNFKEDYLDYYLGIENFVERKIKKELENQLREKQNQITFLVNSEAKNERLQVTKLLDEEFKSYSLNYIKNYALLQEKLVENENDYVLKCNELRFIMERMTVLRKVKKHHVTQNPLDDFCPVCTQSLPSGIAESYRYFQEANDTTLEIERCQHAIKSIQGNVNSLKKSIEDGKLEIEKNYHVVTQYNREHISFDSWLKTKANVELLKNIETQLGVLAKEREIIEEKLEKFKTEDEVLQLRNEKNVAFSSLFSQYLAELNVKPFEEKRFKELYLITAFPSQGVELHKTVMAYHFAFNHIISQSNPIHRFPFMLDAIFKEDIEQDNKDLIMKFITKNRPADTQIIFSLADTSNIKSAHHFNEVFFKGKGKLICIGEGIKERAFLYAYNDDFPRELYEETFDLIDKAR